MQREELAAVAEARRARAIPWRRVARRVLTALVPALVVALPPLFWVIDGTHRASLSTLGRDQGIFQYVAWAIDHGAKDYRDVRDVNGPLTHLVHLVFLHLGGADEHRFRVLDLVMTGLTFALAGACLPGLGRRLRPVSSILERPERLVQHLGWAFAAWVVLSGQYLQYIFWDLAQRESFFDWFLLSSVMLQIVAQAGMRRAGAVWPRRLMVLAGALSIVTWFGKPTFVLFTITQLLALLLDQEPKLTRKARLFDFALGAALGGLTQLVYLLVYADLRAFVRIYFIDVPQMYRFIWPRSAVEIFSMPGVSTTAALSFVTSAAMLGLILDGQMPRRALALALLPLAALGNVVLQAKGFPYHFHPVSAGLHLQWLAIVVWMWERAAVSRARSRDKAGRMDGSARLAPLLAASALALKVAFVMPLSTHITNLWILTKARDAEERSSRDYLVYFGSYDFFPWEMRQTAAYLKEHTKASDKVQMYGMDPYILFLAERMSATPYIYAYDLNADAALAGGQLPEPIGLHPGPADVARIVALRDAHEADLLARLQKEPPAAWVFLDKSPLITWQEAFVDLKEHSPKTAEWVLANYVETATFEADHVWMRRDIAPAPLPKPTEKKAPEGDEVR
jgi:hypothetical protein